MYTQAEDETLFLFICPGIEGEKRLVNEKY